MSMEIKPIYNKHINYIGSSEEQKKYTSKVYEKCSALNYTSYCHDIHYTKMLDEYGFFSKCTLGVQYNLIFLSQGLFRSFHNFQIKGMFYVAAAFIALMIYLPIYIKKYSK